MLTTKKCELPDWLTESFYMRLWDGILKHEGKVNHIYEDSLGNRTVGIGHLILPTEEEWFMATGDTVSEARVINLYEKDLGTAIETTYALFPNICDHPEDVRYVLVDMAFNLGYYRLKSFKRMKKAVDNKDYPKAAAEMLDSLWADQVGRRASHLAKLMESANERITGV